VLVTMAGGVEFPVQAPHEGEEFGIVLKGMVHLKLDNRTFRVKQHECFYFRSNLEHAVVNPGKKEVMILWVVTPPIFG
jgi:mannose-6-phosphate isomerase-like protein (cupin superfamily)